MRIVFLAIFMLVGCGPFVVPIGPDRKPKPVVPVVETVWTVMAEYIADGEIDNTDKLILVMDRLRDRGAITDEGRSAFYEAFPGIRDKRRNTNDDDMAILRKLK